MHLHRNLLEQKMVCMDNNEETGGILLSFH